MLVVILLSGLDDRRRSPPIEHLGEVAGLADVEHDDRNIVIAAEGDRGGIHDLEVVAQHRVEADLVVALGGRDLLRIGGVDAVDARSLEQGDAAHLGGA